jgi:hypothetical protein
MLAEGFAPEESKQLTLQMRVRRMKDALKLKESSNPCLSMEIKEKKSDAPTVLKWTSDDNRRLEELKKKEIAISDTALGRLRETNIRQFEASFASMPLEKRKEWLDKLGKSTQDDSSSGGVTVAADGSNVTN